MDIPVGPGTLTLDDHISATILGIFTANGFFPDTDIDLDLIKGSFPAVNLPVAATANITLNASFGGGVGTGMGVFKDPQTALGKLGLDPAPSVIFPDSGPNDRYLLISFNANATGSVNGTIPFGVAGSATFGVTGAGGTTLAVLHRFDHTTVTALHAIAAAGSNIKVARAIGRAEDLAPFTWIIGEIDGSLAMTLGAKLGYDFAYKKDIPATLQQLGLQQDLSLKIDSALSVQLGYNISGRYLAIVGRPADDQNLTLQLHKQNSYGYNFGLDLSVGVQADPLLPENLGDLVSGAFGLLPQQVANDLKKSIPILEQWTTGDLGANLAALTTDTAKNLLHAVTGLNIDTELSQAVGAVKDALAQWDALATQGSSTVKTLVWNLLGSPDAATQALVTTLLTDLRDNPDFNKALSDGLQAVGTRNWLLGIAEAVGSNSSLSLGAYQDQVRKYAGDILSVLSGSVITSLKKEIDTAFRLSTITSAANTTAINQWVQARLAAFFNKSTFVTADLKSVQAAIAALGKNLSGAYDKLVAALTNKYNFDFAYNYQKTTSNAVMVDLVFDMNQAASQFTAIVQKGQLDVLFAGNGPIPGITIQDAVMTHEIHSKATTHIQIPNFVSDSAVTQDTVAKLQIQRNGASLIAFVDSKVNANGTLYAGLVDLAFQADLSGKVLTDPTLALAYEMRFIKPACTQTYLAGGIQDFTTQYLADKLPAGSFVRFLSDFDAAVIQASRQATPTGGSATAHFDNLGDMAVSMQVAVSGELADAWFVKRGRDEVAAAQLRASRFIQQYLRRYVYQWFMEDSSHATDTEAAHIYAYAALPICTNNDWDGTSANLDSGKSPTWNPGPLPAMKDMLKSMIEVSVATGSLRALADKARVLGLVGGMFNNNPAITTNQLRSTGEQDNQLASLAWIAYAENTIIGNAAKAIQTASDAANQASLDRQMLLKTLADFAQSLTKAIAGTSLANYLGQKLDVIGPLLLAELTRALSTDGQAKITTNAMLQLISLKAGHTFALSDYLAGDKTPADDQVAVSQSLVSVH